MQLNNQTEIMGL